MNEKHSPESGFEMVSRGGQDFFSESILANPTFAISRRVGKVLMADNGLRYSQGEIFLIKILSGFPRSMLCYVRKIPTCSTEVKSATIFSMITSS